MKTKKQKIESVMNWFILLSLVNYYADPEIKQTITKIILSIAGIFAAYKLLKNRN